MLGRGLGLGFGVIFNDTATTEIYTLSLHDALPIWAGAKARVYVSVRLGFGLGLGLGLGLVLWLMLEIGRAHV